MNAKNKRLIIIVLVAVLLLVVPLTAMQFTDEVNWNLTDFIIGGILLLGTGLLIELVMRKVKNVNNRIHLTIAVIVIFLLIWAELAVGIFGTPFAGS